MRDVGSYLCSIARDGFFLLAAVVDAAFILGDYLGKTQGFSFPSFRPLAYELVLLAGILVAAYRRDVQQRDAIAQLQAELLSEREKVEDSHITDPKEIVAALKAEGYEVKFPGVTKWLQFRREGWEDVTDEVAGKRYRLVLGNGQRIDNHIMKRRITP